MTMHHHQSDDPEVDPDEECTGSGPLLVILGVSVVYLILICVAGAALLVLVDRVRAHDAPSGWRYDFACCSGVDCREVGNAYSEHSPIRVFERPEGYVISSTDEVIPYTSRKVRPSPDGLFHWCSVAGKDDSKTICLYVPSRAY